MSRHLKAMVTEVLRKRYEGVSEACIVDVSGLTVGETVRMRRTLTAKGMDIHVVKNSLACRAFEGGPLEVLGNELRGPCALVTGGDSAIEVAKEIVRLVEEYAKLTPKIGLLIGETTTTPVVGLAELKSLSELLAEVAMLVSSPGRSIAGCLASPQANIAGCIKTLADRNDEAVVAETN